MEKDWRNLEGKKVLFSIHGKTNCEPLATGLYDRVVECSEEDPVSLALSIAEISQTASRLDVAAQGSGNRLFLEALRVPIRAPKPVCHYFALFPAVEGGEDFSFSIRKCKDVFIFYSQRGDILPFLYTLAPFERERAFSGEESLARLPQHAQLVDCTDISGEGISLEIGSFMRKRILSLPPMPWQSTNVRLMGDGEVEDLTPKPSRFYDLVYAATGLALSCAGGV